MSHMSSFSSEEALDDGETVYPDEMSEVTEVRMHSECARERARESERERERAESERERERESERQHEHEEEEEGGEEEEEVGAVWMQWQYRGFRDRRQVRNTRENAEVSAERER